MIIFDNFEHDSNLSIIKRYPLSTQTLTGDTLGFLDLYSLGNSQYIDFGETLQPIPTSIDMVIDLTITPLDTTSSNKSVRWFGLETYTNLCVFDPVNTTIGSQEFAYWEGSTEPQRITLHLTLKQVYGHWLVTKKINEDLIFRDKLLTGAVSIPDLSRILSRVNSSENRNIQIHKFVVAYDQEGVIDPTTFNIRPATGTPVGTNISYTGDSLGESINKNSFTETEPRAYTDQFWAKIEIGEEGTTTTKFRGAGNGTVPCFFSIGNSTPQYVEDQQAIPTYFGKGKSTLTVEVARPMVLKFAPKNIQDNVLIGITESGYNFETSRVANRGDYIIYNPTTGQTQTIASNNTRRISIQNIIGDDGGILHIYPTDYRILASDVSIYGNVTANIPSDRLVEVIDFGTVALRATLLNTRTYVAKLPDYLPITINNLEYIGSRASGVSATLSNIVNWDTSRVENFRSCLYEATLDTLPAWDYSSATNMESAFRDLTANTGDINIKTNNVVDLSRLCQNANLPNTNITIDAPNANTISYGFDNATVKSIDLNLVNVTSMNQVFYGTFNTQSLVFRHTEFLKLTDVAGFAQTNSNFNFDLSNWCVPFVTATSNFDTGATSWLSENKPKWGDTSCLS